MLMSHEDPPWFKKAVLAWKIWAAFVLCLACVMVAGAGITAWHFIARFW